MPRTPFSVLFVCLGNICRSPAAENVLRHLVKKEGLSKVIHIDSAGTHDYHPGKSPDSRMTQTLAKRNIPNPGSGRVFTQKDFTHFDLIIAMDFENLTHITALAQNKNDLGKVKRFTDFCTRPEHQVPDVPDPYYGGHEGFELVADMLEDGCYQVLEYAKNNIQS